MSAIAGILAERSYNVTGSDPKQSAQSQLLRQQGARVFQQQNAATIDAICSGVDRSPLVVVSSAVPESNPELEAARKAGLRVVHRSELLAWLINAQRSIAVAGSHGKTTTSSLIASLLHSAGLDPTAIIGGVVPAFGSNARNGAGDWLVAEADESDGSLVRFHPQLGLITNLELDHTDHYRNLDDLINTMQTFSRGCKRLLINRDDPILKDHFRADAYWSIRESKTVDYAGLPVQIEGDRTVIDFYEQGKRVGQVSVPLPGLHNLSNVVAALAACRMEGIPLAALLEAVTELRTPGRRFDFRGDWYGRQIVDDYAHHPSEVKATLTMAQLMVRSGSSPLPKTPKRLLAVFQPHRYSRTKEFLNAFAEALTSADSLVLAPIYGAGESPIPGVDNERLAYEIRRLNPHQPVFIADSLEELTDLVIDQSQPDDLILAMGAGDVNSLWERLSQESLEGESCPSALAA